MIDIFSLTKDDLKNIIAEHKMENYRANQIFSFLYKRGVDNFDDIYVLKKEQREYLKSHFSITRPSLKTISTTDYGTKKYLFQLKSLEHIESVLIPMRDDKFTICISTQVGCKMNCKFCATGKMGFKKNLTAAEIVSQVMFIMQDNNLKNSPNIVYMGMGEPLDNYDNTIKSLKILTDPDGLNISRRRITISTCGIVDGINKLKTDFPNINIAISLHTAINAKRDKIMPINRRYNINDIMQSLKDFPLPRRKRITFEYVMIKGFNDTKEDEKALLKLLSHQKSKLNLILLNKHEFLNDNIQPSDLESINSFAEHLRKKGMFVTIRDSKGSSINAACGMLAVRAS